ncbi:hypothetical protein C4565_02430 [Candidatus Parcubacteria bacterium]|nr:MAG: hypothetical protein C4565_02430 [Candidatus Parcubacteria bacterium]
MSLLKKLINIFSTPKKKKFVEPLENLDALRKDFLETNARLLAERIASMFGGSDYVYILTNVLDKKVEEPPESFKELLKGADLPTLLKEFQAVHLMMLTALNEHTQEKLNVRLTHVAVEIANRSGGPDFFRKLNTVLKGII